jgi:hypothetical protein
MRGLFEIKNLMVGRSFRNANQVTIVGGPISLGVTLRLGAGERTTSRNGNVDGPKRSIKSSLRP